MIWYIVDVFISYCSYCRDYGKRVIRKRFEVNGSCLEEDIICILEGKFGVKNCVKFIKEIINEIGEE